MRQTGIKFIVALALLLSAMGHLWAQEAVLLKTKQGFIQLKAWNSSSGVASSSTCVSDGCSLSNEYVLDQNSTRLGHQALLSAQNFAISAKHQYQGATRNGASESDYTVQLYSRVVPDAKLRIKVDGNTGLEWHNSYAYDAYWSNVSVTAGFSFSNSDFGGATSASDGAASTGNPGGAITKALSITVSTSALPQSPVLSDGGTYYYIGTVKLNGKVEIQATWWWNGPTPAADGSFTASVGNIDVRYIGNALSKVDGDTQTWRVNGTLPKPLKIKVADGVTGTPYANAPITFWLADPGKGGEFVNGGVSITTHTNASGFASVLFTLGPSTGTYLINVTCPADVCTSGARQVTFTETAKGTKLACLNCEWYDKVGRELANPFKLQVVDGLTGAPVAGASIDYEVISFTDGNTTIHGPNPHGAWITRFYPPASDSDGKSVAYMVLGTEPGVYTARARCESCVSGQEQILVGIARTRNIEIHAKKTTKADPEDTPIVQITQVLPPNDGKSFTTADGENRVVLQARLLPANLDQNLIHWDTEDAPDDFIDSGIAQMEENYGPENALKMRLTTAGGGVPVAATGRALPLGYVVTAGANVPGKVVVPSVITVRQDQIDKCRQEYVDMGVGLRSEIMRSAFTLGLHEEYANPLKIKDCYAYIYPQLQAQKVGNLRAAGHKVKVTSGYRSPRYNAVYSSTNSTHIFGEAVDINPVDSEKNAAGWETLWEDNNNAGCPKSLEKIKPDGKIGVMMWCNGSQQLPQNAGSYPGSENLMYNQAYCIHLGNAGKDLENTPDN